MFPTSLAATRYGPGLPPAVPLGRGEGRSRERAARTWPVPYHDISVASCSSGAGLQSFAPEYDAGSVNVLCGTDDGLSATGDPFWSQNSTGISGSVEAYDRFGSW